MGYWRGVGSISKRVVDSLRLEDMASLDRLTVALAKLIGKSRDAESQSGVDGNS